MKAIVEIKMNMNNNESLVKGVYLNEDGKEKDRSLICDHRAKTDLTSGLGPIRHWYCRRCGIHWYKDREWAKREWEEWINE